MSTEEPTVAILVGLASSKASRSLLEEHLDELERLVDTAGGRVAARIVQERRSPDPASWVGRGKVEEIAESVRELGAQLLVVEGDLSPVQLRNLQDATSIRVLDRTDLILDIFALHARTREARLAVELALLEQQLPRLAGQWYGLSRQGGGIGTRGLGEKRLELDRRVVRTRLARLKRELERLEVSRELQRRGRQQVAIVALAGYTNAGKSTLFRRLTGQKAYVADQLFATLDARHARLPEEIGPAAVLVDTVGFIRNLPHRLVATFRSTLGEIRGADMVLHVVDQSHPAADEQIRVVEETLRELEVTSDRVLLVRNKIDLLGPRLVDSGLAVSARSGTGIEDLLAEIGRRLSAAWRTVEIDLDPADGRTLAEVQASGEVLGLEERGDRLHLVARLPADLVGRLERRGLLPVLPVRAS